MKSFGKSIALANQSNMMPSNSVHDGPEAQENPMHPIVSPTISANIDGYDAPDGK